MFVFPSADLILPLILFLDGDHHPQHQLRQFAQHISSSIVVATVDGDTSSHITAETAQYEWNLPNGRVQFERPLSFKGIERLHDGKLQTSSGDSSAISLWNPTLLGGGGSGAVLVQWGFGGAGCG